MSRCACWVVCRAQVFVGTNNLTDDGMIVSVVGTQGKRTIQNETAAWAGGGREGFLQKNKVYASEVEFGESRRSRDANETLRTNCHDKTFARPSAGALLDIHEALQDAPNPVRSRCQVLALGGQVPVIDIAAIMTLAL